MTRLWKYVPLVLVILGAGTFRVWSDYNLSQGTVSPIPFASKVIGGTVHHPAVLTCDATVGETTCAAVKAASTAAVAADPAMVVSVSPNSPATVVQPAAASLNATVVNGGTFAVQASQSGTWNVSNVSGTVSLPTGASTSALQTTGNTSLATIATAVQAPVPLPAASGGWTYKILNGTTNTGVNVKASAGTLAMVHCYNPNASVAYIQFYNNAGTPTVGTAVQLAFGVPATNSTGFALPVNGIQFTTGIAVAATTTATGSTAPGTALDCNVAYN